MKPEIHTIKAEIFYRPSGNIIRQHSCGNTKINHYVCVETKSIMCSRLYEAGGHEHNALKQSRASWRTPSFCSSLKAVYQYWGHRNGTLQDVRLTAVGCGEPHQVTEPGFPSQP